MNPETASTKIIESGAFGALCVILLFFIWWLVREQSRKDDEHTKQIERINASHDASIEKVTATFTTQIDKMMVMAAQDRKESAEAFNKLSALISNVIEKRGRIDMRADLNQ